MCGRYTLTAPVGMLRELFQLEFGFGIPPRYNIAPTQEVPVVRADESGTRRLDFLRWGLIPSWAKEASIGNRMINARFETVAEKPAFRSAFKRRRCLVVADGFYEWKKEVKSKHPYYIYLRRRRPFAFAGLWENWQGPQGPVESVTIITTVANDLVNPLHNRMPVILPPSAYALWLDSKAEDKRNLLPLLKPYSSGDIEMHPVSKIVNSPKNDSPDCIEPSSE